MHNSTNHRFKNKIVLITGGNSGIGLTSAEKFIAEGAKVIITGRDKHKLSTVQSKLGENSFAIQTDATNLTEIEKLFKQVKEKFNRLDVLFVNAGIAKTALVEDTTEAIFDEIFNINVKGAYFTMQKALPLMSNGGTIVINSSLANSIGAAEMSVYSASKAAVRSFARTISREYVDRGIRVNVVSPGPIETPIWESMSSLVSQEELLKKKQKFTDANPMKRFGTSEEVADAVLFLASKDSSYILGSEIFVDGGVSQL
jgi:NAD(P)-dependent dehydrogenase (short-subunit alcohol dehydrogenase family)